MSVGLLTAGLACVALVGTGIASADPADGTDDGPGTAQSAPPSDPAPDDPAKGTNPVASQDDSNDPPDPSGPAQAAAEDDEPARTTITGTVPPPAATDDSEAVVIEEPAESDSGSKPGNAVEPNLPAKSADGHARSTPKVDPPTVEVESVESNEEPAEPDITSTRTDAAPEPTEAGPLLAVAKASVDSGSPAVAAMRLAVARAEAAAPAPSPGPTIVNVIATIAFTLFDYVNKILQGPPVVPAGSTVKVGRSDLNIDCGDGYTAEADWYFPTDGEADKLIYFQHGILATSGFYNVTAAELAERNNAIVVAPSITSNFFACDACNLSSDQMHAAVAALFTGDRAALTESAEAAAEQAGVDAFEGLPQRFVISGHSAGGQLAAGAAGYYYRYAPEPEKADLVGVLLFDTSAVGGALAQALDELPLTLPVLHISATPGFFNTFGDANEVLDAMRPGQFNGVRLIGGSHSDAFRSSTLGGITQLLVGIGTGFSAPANVEANQVLAQGWIADMYAGTVYDPNARTGIYGPLGTVVDVPTPGVGSGSAQALVLPVPPNELAAWQLIVQSLLGSLNLTDAFAACAEDPSAVFDRQVDRTSRKISTGDTALSLDGRRQTGQSVGQHVCTG